MNTMDAPVETSSVAALHGVARRRLAEAGVATPDLDARLLVEWASGFSRLVAVTEPERAVSAEATEKVHAAIARRLAGEPVHRIIGTREFYGLAFRLSPDTLEPRPDTETLVDLALPHLCRSIEERGAANLLDLGTGTGAIAIALLSQLDNLDAVGTDIASGALDAARDNAEAAGVTRRFAAIESDWFSAVSGRFDLIISNPPYICTNEIASLQLEVRRHDPIRALDGGADGLDAYRILAGRSASHLLEDGAVIVEIGAGQRRDVVCLFESGGFRFERAAKDLAGLDRALVFRLAEPAMAGD